MPIAKCLTALPRRFPGVPPPPPADDRAAPQLPIYLEDWVDQVGRGVITGMVGIHTDLGPLQ
jgi:hypothetical protein